jgi:D-lactate dehydrogenase
MRVAVFSTRPFDRDFLTRAAQSFDHELTFLEPRLTIETASLASGFPAVCVFVNDHLDAPTLEALAREGVRFIALRCAGFNNVDLPAAARLGLQVIRVPAYSPHSVAEHTVALILSLNRKIHRAWSRVRDGNFALNGLMGFDLNGRTAGLIGTGIIGAVVARILTGFGCRILAYDVRKNPDCEALGAQYVELPELWAGSDIISLHCPLTPQTHYLINESSLAQMRRGVMLINTSRGAVVDTAALIAGLKSGHIGSVGLDVYEEESHYFFTDLSNEVIADDQLARLLTFPNVLVTGHQAFFTEDAMHSIAQTTLQNLTDLEQTGTCANCVRAT